MRHAQIALSFVLLASLVTFACEAPHEPASQHERVESIAASQTSMSGQSGLVDASLLVQSLILRAKKGASYGMRGALRDIDYEAFHLVIEIVELLTTNLPDAEAAVSAVESYVSDNKERSADVGEALEARRKRIPKKKRGDYEDDMEERFASYVENYELVVADFERLADQSQILRFNASMKRLQANLHSN